MANLRRPRKGFEYGDDPDEYLGIDTFEVDPDERRVRQRTYSEDIEDSPQLGGPDIDTEVEGDDPYGGGAYGGYAGADGQDPPKTDATQYYPTTSTSGPSHFGYSSEAGQGEDDLPGLGITDPGKGAPAVGADPLAGDDPTLDPSTDPTIWGSCPEGYITNLETGDCEPLPPGEGGPDLPTCPEGQEPDGAGGCRDIVTTEDCDDPNQTRCADGNCKDTCEDDPPQCDPGFHLENGECVPDKELPTGEEDCNKRIAAGEDVFWNGDSCLPSNTGGKCENQFTNPDTLECEDWGSCPGDDEELDPETNTCKKITGTKSTPPPKTKEECDNVKGTWDAAAGKCTEIPGTSTTTTTGTGDWPFPDFTIPSGGIEGDPSWPEAPDVPNFDAFNKRMNELFAQFNKGTAEAPDWSGLGPEGRALWKRLMGETGELDEERLTQRFGVQRDLFDRAFQSQLATAQRALADRGMMPISGVQQGAYPEAIQQIGEELQPRYATGLQEAMLGESELADARLSNALQNLTGLAGEEAQNLLALADSQGRREEMVQQITLDYLNQTRQWAEFLSEYNLREAEVSAAIKQGRFQALINAFEAYLKMVGISAGGQVMTADQIKAAQGGMSG